MKLHKSIYKVFFIVAILLQSYIDSVEFLVLFTSCISFLLLLESKVKISKTAFNTLSFLTAILILGFLIGLFKNYTVFDKLRDFIHFLKPITVILSGYLLARKIENTTFILKTLVYIAFFGAIYHLIILISLDLKIGTIEEIRLKAGAGNLIEVIALVILIGFDKKYYNVINDYGFKIVIICILSASVFFYFSRTMLLGLVVIFLTLYGFTKLNRKTIEYTSLLLVLIGVFYAYLFSIKITPDKPGINNFLFKIKNAPAEIFLTPQDYDPKNHKEIFKHWRGYEASRALKAMNKSKISYVTGFGFGALVDLEFNAPIGGKNGIRFIPHLHNGYAYIFFKTGLLGLLLYVILLSNLYKQLYIKTTSKKEKMFRYLIAGLSVYYFATSFVITGLYNLSEISIFCLGVFLSLSSYEKLNFSVIDE